MDTLPKEIINEIKYFCRLPHIDIIQENFINDNGYTDMCVYICIRYRMMSTKLPIGKILLSNGCANKIYQYSCNNKAIDSIDGFINDLSNKKDSFYEEQYNMWGEEEYFGINVENENIEITEGNVQINLHIENKDQLINAMKKYRDLLNTYIKM